MSQVESSSKSLKKEASPRTIIQLFKKLPDYLTKQEVFRLLQNHMEEVTKAEQARIEAENVRRQRIADFQKMLDEEGIHYTELAPSVPATKTRKPRTPRATRNASIPAAGTPDLPNTSKA